MKKGAENIVVVKLENHKVPEIKEVRGKDWVLFGEQNDYPDWLLNLFNRSAIHNAIITGKVNYIVGKGFKTSGDANDKQNWNDLLSLFATDFELFNAFCFEVIPNKGGTGNQYFHVDISKIRTNADHSKFYYTSQWTKDGYPNVRPDREPDWKVWDAYDGKKGLVYYKYHRPGMYGTKNIYTLPDYVGCVTEIATDVEVSNYHYNNVRNGFSQGVMVNFNNGEPTPEAKKEIQKKFEAKATGTDKAGGVILSFNNTKEREATVVNLQPTDLDKQFLQLTDRTQQAIFTGHKITSPMLFGVKTEGQLGGRTELIDAYELFLKTYIMPRQAKIVSVLNDVTGLSFEIEQNEPLGMSFSETTLKENLTQDEIREKAGFPPLDKPQKSQTQATIEALSTLPALVANQILGSMTGNEIRALAALPEIEGGDVIPGAPEQAPTTMRKFSSEQEKEDAIIQRFSELGTSAENFYVIREKYFHFHNMADIYKEEISAMKFSITKDVLDILSGNPSTKTKDIAKQLGIDEKEVDKAIKQLEKKKLIDITEEGISITPEGSERAEIPSEIEIAVMYKYALSPMAPALAKGGKSRPFCIKMMNLSESKYWSLDAIEKIKNEFGTDVWTSRGGWYNNPETGEKQDYCRHIWKAVIVKKK